MSYNNMGDIKDGWNTKNFHTLRQNMIDGAWSLKSPLPPAKILNDPVKIVSHGDCANCAHKEGAGLGSQRINWLTNYKAKFADVYETKTTVNADKIYHLNLNFSNICNYKCRMCKPANSNAWIPDYKFLDRNNISIGTDDTRVKQIIDMDEVLATYGSNFDTLRSIWVTGGEPLMDDSLVTFAKNLEKYCDVGNIKMSITTNGSKLNFKKLPELNNFKQITYDMSIDTVGPAFEYMRSAGVYSWDKLAATIEQLREFRDAAPNVTIEYNASYQIYNMLAIEEFYKYFAERRSCGEFIQYRLVTSDYLAARHAPDNIKLLANEQIIRLLAADYITAVDRKYLINCQKMLLLPRNAAHWHRFLVFTSALDFRRKQYLKDYIPELYNLLSSDDKILVDGCDFVA